MIPWFTVWFLSFILSASNPFHRNRPSAAFRNSAAFLTYVAPLLFNVPKGLPVDLVTILCQCQIAKLQVARGTRGCSFIDAL